MKGRRFHSLPEVVWLACAASLAVGGFIFISAGHYGVGFPLDDAWIHQTYARNLALAGEWSFVPGRPSAGSTSPLWSLLLAAGYALRLDALGWAYLLGGAMLTALAAMLTRYGRLWGGELQLPAVGIGVFVIFEYHLAWAAASGMETLLSALVNTAVILLIARDSRRFLLLGGLIGLGLWVRPDSLTLLGPAAVYLVYRRRERCWRNAGQLLLGFGAFLAPYLLFNLYLDGNWWPNTYYAKQAEYAVLLNQPLLARLGRLFSVPLIGAGITLAPGFLVYAAQAARRRDLPVLLGLAWWAGFIGLYALRLPVVYQHGRYLMPVMPLYCLWGLLGTSLLIGRLKGTRWGNLAGFAITMTIFLVLWGFWLLGGRAYARDVGFIETQMVATAQWVAEHVEEGALVAAHDIGALGYYGGRELLDLAGLVSPEVIPFIRDEAALSAYLSARGADYLVTLRNWYSRLPDCGEPVYLGDAVAAQTLGSDRMAVYRWRAGCRLE